MDRVFARVGGEGSELLRPRARMDDLRSLFVMLSLRPLVPGTVRRLEGCSGSGSDSTRGECERGGRTRGGVG